MTSWTPSDVRCWATSLCKLFIRGRYSLPQCIRTAITSTFFAWVSQTSRHEFRCNFYGVKHPDRLKARSPWTYLITGSLCRIAIDCCERKPILNMRSQWGLFRNTPTDSSAGKRVRSSHDWFWFCILSVERLGRVFFFFQTNHRVRGENQTQATLELILLVAYSSISKLLIKQLQGKPLYINTSSLNEDWTCGVSLIPFSLFDLVSRLLTMKLGGHGLGAKQR